MTFDLTEDEFLSEIKKSLDNPDKPGNIDAYTIPELHKILNNSNHGIKIGIKKLYKVIRELRDKKIIKSVPVKRKNLSGDIYYPDGWVLVKDE